jgi:hypothetical protein
MVASVSVATPASDTSDCSSTAKSTPAFTTGATLAGGCAIATTHATITAAPKGLQYSGQQARGHGATSFKVLNVVFHLQLPLKLCFWVWMD